MVQEFPLYLLYIKVGFTLFTPYQTTQSRQDNQNQLTINLCSDKNRMR